MALLKILIIDDEEGMRLAIRRSLKNYKMKLADMEDDISFDIEEASTGEDGLEKISSYKPDIVLLDHKLPQMSGLDVLSHISEKKYDLITIMITAYASIETAIIATKRGGYDFLPKPFTPDELKSCIYRAIKFLSLQRHARNLDEERRQFRFKLISIVSHELKSPLNAIEGYLNIIKDRSAGDDQNVYDNFTGRCLIRLNGMRKLITDLLDLTRIESGQRKRQLTDVNILEIAKNSIEMMAATASERGIVIELSSDEQISINADMGEMEMVLNNLISNAVKYNRDNGQVKIYITSDNEFITIKVSDTGIGMTEDEVSKLFNEFVRIKNTKTQNILGSGLGLSIIKKIASLYEGDVTVSSKPDCGTTFVVTLKK